MALPAKPDIVEYTAPPVYGETKTKTQYKFATSSHIFDSRQAAEDTWESFENIYRNLEQNAQMIAKCKEVELSVGVLSGIVKGIKESCDYTVNALENAVSETSQGNIEENLQQANGEISSLSSSLSKKIESVSDWDSRLEEVNNGLSTAGESMIQYHRKLYPEYVNLCGIIGISEIQSFYAGGE